MRELFLISFLYLVVSVVTVALTSVNEFDSTVTVLELMGSFSYNAFSITTNLYFYKF